MEDILFPILDKYTSTDGQDIFEEVRGQWGGGLLTLQGARRVSERLFQGQALALEGLWKGHPLPFAARMLRWLADGPTRCWGHEHTSRLTAQFRPSAPLSKASSLRLPGVPPPQIMQLATYLTYFAPQISPRMWTLFPRMLQASGGCGLPTAYALCACKHCPQACCTAKAVAASAEGGRAGAAGWGVPCAGRSLPAHFA